MAGEGTESEDHGYRKRIWERSCSSSYIPVRMWHRKLSLIFFSQGNYQILKMHKAEDKKPGRNLVIVK